MYDLENDKWKILKSSMKTPRYECGAAVLNGKIYVCGGRDGNDRILRTVEVYDPTTDRYFITF